MKIKMIKNKSIVSNRYIIERLIVICAYVFYGPIVFIVIPSTDTYWNILVWISGAFWGLGILQGIFLIEDMKKGYVINLVAKITRR